MNLKSIFILFFLYLVHSVCYAVDIEKIDLPDMGDSTGRLISPQQEQELGAAFFRNLHSQIKINQDLEIQHYIQTLGGQLAANSDQPGYPFKFFMVIDQSINAFAGPGGYIGINSGLLLLSESESELAAVMAHEIAHVTQRHLYRAFEAARQMSIPNAAATLAAILLGTQSPELGQAALIALQAGNTQFQIDFTRDNEKEADRVGMQTLVDADYDPRSMPVFFERLQQSTRYYGRDIPEFLRTHPVSVSRISDTRGRSEKYPYKQYPDSKEYLLAKAKLRVLSVEDQEVNLKYFKAHIGQGTQWQQAVARYGLALVYIKTLNFDKADTLLTDLSRAHPGQPQFANALAKTAIENRQFERAVKLYRTALKAFPNNLALEVAYVKSLLNTGHPDQAKKVLEKMAPNIKNQLLYYELLAQCYADLNQPAESHRFLAEYYYANGQTKTAIMQIKLAQNANRNNFYLQSILNERLSLFLAEEKQRRRDR